MNRLPENPAGRADQLELSQLDLRYEGYRLRQPRLEDALLSAIAREGIREPLHGVRDGRQAILLDGFKRQRCARQLRLEVVPFVSWGIDEAGGILSMRYCRGLVMTACLDALDFYAPIHANEVVTFKAGLNHVGTSSLEIGVKVLSEVPWTGQVKHACTAYLTFVHLGPSPGADLRPTPCRPYTPESPAEQRRFAQAVERRARRLERVKTLKPSPR